MSLFGRYDKRNREAASKNAVKVMGIKEREEKLKELERPAGMIDKARSLFASLSRAMEAVKKDMETVKTDDQRKREARKEFEVKPRERVGEKLTQSYESAKKLVGNAYDKFKDTETGKKLADASKDGKLAAKSTSECISKFGRGLRSANDERKYRAQDMKTMSAVSKSIKYGLKREELQDKRNELQQKFNELSANLLNVRDNESIKQINSIHKALNKVESKIDKLNGMSDRQQETLNKSKAKLEMMIAPVSRSTEDFKAALQAGKASCKSVQAVTSAYSGVLKGAASRVGQVVSNPFNKAYIATGMGLEQADTFVKNTRSNVKTKMEIARKTKEMNRLLIKEKEYEQLIDEARKAEDSKKKSLNSCKSGVDKLVVKFINLAKELDKRGTDAAMEGINDLGSQIKEVQEVQGKVRDAQKEYDEAVRDHEAKILVQAEIIKKFNNVYNEIQSLKASLPKTAPKLEAQTV